MRVQQLLHEAAILDRNGSFDEAERRYRAALKLLPSDPAVQSLLGTFLAAQGRPKESARLLRRVIGTHPADGDAHYNLGIVLQQLEDHEEAINSFRRSMSLLGDSADAQVNIGVSLYALGRHADALACCERALAMRPGFPPAHNNAGNALEALGRHEEALARFDAAIAADAGYAVAHNNRGNTLKSLGRHREAIASYENALRLDPENQDAPYLKGLTQLALGEYQEGWRGYELRRPAGTQRKLRQPRWRGEPLEGKSILLQAEEGLGDTIQFARYVPLIARKGATVVLEVYSPLVPLMRGMPGASRVVGLQDKAPHTDFHCPLPSLPGILGTSVETIPPPVAYLSLAPEAVSAWRRKLGGDQARLVGLGWRGNPKYVNDAQRSIPFAKLAPLWTVPGVRFISLQKELTADERIAAGMLPQLHHPGADFEATARMIGALDAVISIDTSWLHWAGSIGTPAWALLSFAPHWPWLIGREESPWYPGMRLLRQPAPRAWEAVVERAAAALTGLAARRAGS